MASHAGLTALADLHVPMYESASDPGAVGAGKWWFDTATVRIYRRNAGNSAWVLLSASAAADLPSGIDAAKISAGSVSNAEFDRLDGVTSGIQTQLDAKAAIDLGGRPYVRTFDSSLNVGTGTLTANRVYLCEIDWPANIASIATLKWYVAAPGTGNHVLAGVYSFDGSTFTRLNLTASTLLDGINAAVASAALGASVNRPATLRRYLAIICDTAVPTVIRVGGLAATNGLASRVVQHDPGSFTLPSTIAVGSVAGTVIIVWVYGE
jgi:hypothetical protein